MSKPGSAEAGKRRRALNARLGLAALLFCLALTGCAPVGAARPLAPTAVPASPARAQPSPAAVQLSTPVPAAGSATRLAIYTPATPSSVPVLLAGRRLAARLPGGQAPQITVYTNQAQANTLFLRGDSDILVTGLSVGVEFFKSGTPVQVVNTYVSGLTYLVTYGTPVADFAALRGQQVYIPFAGSPIEETTQFFAEREGLVWKQDIKPVYAPFASSVELLKLGKAFAVALPEPYVTLVTGQAPVYVSLDYRARWDALTGHAGGYPQVAAFALKPWAAAHSDLIAALNTELAGALQTIEADPSTAVDQTAAPLGLERSVLATALQRTSFAFRAGDAMAQEIQGYYQVIGKPLDATYGPFFYRGPQ